MTYVVERLREVFQRRRYGKGAEYDPDFDLFDVAADEIERLRSILRRCMGGANVVDLGNGEQIALFLQEPVLDRTQPE